MVQRVELEIGGKTLSIETGKVALQANGAAMVRLGDTVTLSAVCAADKPMEGQDFFPLTVDYREKAYAAGKIPGGFFKREGRPSEKEILSMRIIDRPLRPLFPDDFKNEVQCHNLVLSSDQQNDADILAFIGTAASLVISDIPFTKTVAGVRVGRIDGQFIIFPTFEELEQSDINVTIAGSAESIIMVEGGGKEVSEAAMLDALAFGHEHIRKIIEKIDELRTLAGKPKFEYPPVSPDESLINKVTTMAGSRFDEFNRVIDKTERNTKKHAFNDEIRDALIDEFPESEVTISDILHSIDAKTLRNMVINDNRRLDGRGLDDVRQITCEIGVLPRTHGSALFTRGQTQALVVLTLGTKLDEQRVDDLEGESFKSYMLHYNFPSFSVGEIRPIRGVGRREIGHGALAERALQPVIPSDVKFPYTIRLVSDILESNGSSSMASVCGGSLALMDGGVPVKAPVAGVAMGLIKEGDKVAILTDIIGDEDHFGDMDFKVTGTAKGITAYQMDIKISGIDLDIMRQALERARVARLHILDKMNATISKSKEELSQYAPRIITIKIPIDKIGTVIGPGGKMIRSIIESTGAKVDIDDDGTVLIASVDGGAGAKAREMIEALVEEPEIGKKYGGTVRRITNFGAFVEILPGTDGLLHISEIDHKRVERVEDYFKVGDSVDVQIVNIDPEGKIRPSRKALLKS